MKYYNITVNGVAYSVSVEETAAGAAPVAPAAAPAPKAAPAPAAAAVEVAAGDTPITAPMPGKVSKIMKKVGDKIAKGECIMTLEAMKMQNEIGAPVSGTIKSINVNKGDGVKPGQTMAVISN